MQQWSILKVEKTFLCVTCRDVNVKTQQWSLIRLFQPNVGFVMRLRTVDLTCKILL